VAVHLRLGMLGLALGYFLWYTPYAALTKALSSGLLPGVGGLVLLPAAALGTLVGSLLFLTASGWWRYASRRRIAGRFVPWPGRTLVVAGLFMSIVIATTTLNFTFAGVSILFMLLMMRGGVLILSPVVDALRRRPVRVSAWVALTFSLLAVTAALADVDHYALTAAAVLSLTAYLVGYIGRFQIMGRVAKTGDVRTDRGYLVGEQMAAAVWQVALCAVLAIIGTGPALGALRTGFTTFLLTPAAVPAFCVGLLYEALFIYGTLIYLDPREYTWCVPANRCASVLSGVVASYGLAWIAGAPAPGPGQLVATGFVGLAILALCYPVLRVITARAAVPLRQAVLARPGVAAILAKRVTAPRPPAVAEPRLLFVCSGNTGRSAMAEAIARAELAGLYAAGAGPADRRLVAASAGLSARPGAPMAGDAVAALQAIGVPAHRHSSRQLVSEMCRDSAAVYCMTQAQLTAVTELAPEARDRTFCLDPTQDIPDPAQSEPGSYQRVARLISRGVRQRLREQVAAFSALQPQAGG